MTTVSPGEMKRASDAASLWSRRVHRNVVDGARGFEANFALGIIEECCDARIAKFAHRQHRGHAQRRDWLATKLADLRAVTDPSERLHASVAEKRIAIGVDCEHRNDRGLLLTRAKLAEGESGESADARRFIGAELAQFFRSKTAACLTEHARGLCAHLVVAIVENRQREPRGIKVALNPLAIGWIRIAQLRARLLPERPNGVNARGALSCGLRDVAEKFSGGGSSRRKGELRAHAHTAIGVRKQRRKLVRIALGKALFEKTRDLADARIFDARRVPHRVEPRPSCPTPSRRPSR